MTPHEIASEITRKHYGWKYAESAPLIYDNLISMITEALQAAHRDATIEVLEALPCGCFTTCNPGECARCTALAAALVANRKAIYAEAERIEDGPLDATLMGHDVADMLRRLATKNREDARATLAARDADQRRKGAQIVCGLLGIDIDDGWEGPDGEPLLPRLNAAIESGPGRHIVSLQSSHDQACIEAGVSFCIYDFRHTFATRMAESGVDIVTLAAILGHSGLRMVMRYVHPQAHQKREAMRKYEQWMKAGSRRKAVKTKPSDPVSTGSGDSSAPAKPRTKGRTKNGGNR